MRAAASLIATAVLLPGAACGGDDRPAPDRERQPPERSGDARPRKTPSGRQLFVQRCGSCHTLADAGTTGAVGPNLDEHFGPHHPPHIAEILDTIGKGRGRMPANRVRGRDARAVAKYVARVTGK